MIKLDPPTITHQESFNQCSNMIADGLYKTSILEIKEDLKNAGEEYINKASTMDLHLISHTNCKATDIYINGLKRNEVTKLYTYYLVTKSRYIYDEIKLSSNEECPYCSGIGRVTTLDHYLPQAHYPLLSILPVNLIPSCQDCNKSKLNSLARDAEEQSLHPYFDDLCYFQEQWLSARIKNTSPVNIEYFISPPTSWNNTQKKRVLTHFQDFKLAERFAKEVASELTTIEACKKTILGLGTTKDLQDHLNRTIQNLPINHWKSVLYRALAEDNRFCSN